MKWADHQSFQRRCEDSYHLLWTFMHQVRQFTSSCELKVSNLFFRSFTVLSGKIIKHIRTVHPQSLPVLMLVSVSGEHLLRKPHLLSLIEDVVLPPQISARSSGCLCGFLTNEFQQLHLSSSQCVLKLQLLVTL